MTTTPTASPELPDLDLDELETLCKNAPAMWYGTLQIADGVTDDNAALLIEACSPDTVAELVRLARRALPEGEARPNDDKMWDETLRDRDTYQEWADKLAGAIAIHFGVDIGEHSNANCPWHEALEAIESAPSTAVSKAWDRSEHAMSKPEGEAPQADEVAEDEVVGYALRHKETGKYGSWLYPHEHRAMLAKQRDSNYSGPYPLYARQPAAQQAAAPGAQPGEALRMSTTDARGYLVDFMMEHFSDKTFHRYIRGEGRTNFLAGDFAWQMATALRKLEAAPSAPGTPEAPKELDLSSITSVVLQDRGSKSVIVRFGQSMAAATKFLDQFGTLVFSQRAAQLDGGQGEGA